MTARVRCWQEGYPDIVEQGPVFAKEAVKMCDDIHLARVLYRCGAGEDEVRADIHWPRANVRKPAAWIHVLADRHS